MSVRVHVRVLVPVHVQPVPEAAVAVRPLGSWSRSVIVLPSVGSSETLLTVSVIVPVPPRTKTSGACVAATRSGCGTVTHGDGGVPARTSGTYGTGLMTGGIGFEVGT